MRFRILSLTALLTGAVAKLPRSPVCATIPRPSDLSGFYTGVYILHHSGNDSVITQNVPSQGNVSEGLSALKRPVGEMSNASFGAEHSGGKSTPKTGELTLDIHRSHNRYWDFYGATLRLYNFLSPNKDDDRLLIRGVRPANGKSLFMHGKWIWPYVPNSPNPPRSSRHCALTATFDRYHGPLTGDLPPPEDLHGPSIYDTPEFEINADYYQRPPDMIGRIMLSPGCATSARVLTVALRRVDLSWHDPNFRAELFLMTLALIQGYLTLRQEQRTAQQRSSHKLHPGVVLWMFASDMAEIWMVYSTLPDFPHGYHLIYAIPKIWVDIIILNRWFFNLLFEDLTRYFGEMVVSDPREVNRRLMAMGGIIMIALLWLAFTASFFPEPIVILMSLIFIAQIAANAYNGSRDALSRSFVIGILLCKFLFFFFVFSESSRELMIGMPILHTRAQNILPKWFGGPDAPRISSKMIDPIFYNVRRRPNQTLLVIVGILMFVQGAWLFLQNYWSPRVFLPRCFCDRYLPQIHDYVLNVTDVAESKKLGNFKELMGVDCVICMTGVKFTDLDCVVTPCEHFYHSNCLMKWMEVKLECPTCRGRIPFM